MSIRMHVLTDENGKRHEVSEGVYRSLFGGDDDVLPDRSVVKVPVMMRDGQPLATDPRFAPPTMDQLREIETARDEYIAHISNAWRNNNAAPPAVADSTVKKFPMRTSIPQPPPRPPVVHDERETAYNEYLDYLTHAWHREKST